MKFVHDYNSLGDLPATIPVFPLDGALLLPRACWLNALYFRTVPGHAIEMTSALLDAAGRRSDYRLTRANVELLVNNARVAAEVATAFAGP